MTERKFIEKNSAIIIDGKLRAKLKLKPFHYNARSGKVTCVFISFLYDNVRSDFYFSCYIAALRLKRNRNFKKSLNLGGEEGR